MTAHFHGCRTDDEALSTDNSYNRYNDEIARGEFTVFPAMTAAFRQHVLGFSVVEPAPLVGREPVVESSKDTA